MPFYGEQNLLLSVRPCIAINLKCGKNSGGHALLRSENVAVSPYPDTSSHGVESLGQEAKMKAKKILYLLLGFVGLALGALGALLPMLPAFPFLLLAAFCFGKSSERLDRWFRTTSLYQKNLATYVRGEGMTKNTKKRVICTITLLMLVSALLMLRKSLYIPCAILGAVWLFHVLYFWRIVKTCSNREE